MRTIEWQTYGQTVIHPFALGLTLFMGLLMLFLPHRKYVIVPLFIGSLFVTMLQRIVVFSLDFNMIRILVLFGWVRIIFDKERFDLKLNRIDKTIILWAISSIVFYTILWKTSSAFINRLGVAFNIIGLYFLFRLIIKNRDDIFFVINVLVFICIPLAVAMLIENRTRRNIFSIFGGVPNVTIIREGRLRCQGPFTHPILAGTFGASLVPLFVALWFRGGTNRLKAAVGVVSATIMTLTSSSSGPIMTYFAGIIGLSFWPFRHNMRIIKWGMALMLIGLHFVMEAPVWALVARVSVIGGSTGYHRFALLDNFIRRFEEWFFYGVKTTAHWGWGLQDVTNQYVRIGIDGGIVTLGLFILILIFCFRGLGRVRKVLENKKVEQICIWALGSTLFSHLVSFYGVSYFDQIIVIWFLLLGMISLATSISTQKKIHVNEV